MANTKKSTKVVPTLLKLYLSNLDKTEKELQTEKATDNLEDLIIGCKDNISFIESSKIPPIEVSINRLQRELIKAKKAEELSYSDLSTNSFSNYLTCVNTAIVKIENVEAEIAKAKATLTEYNIALKSLYKILKKLES